VQRDDDPPEDPPRQTPPRTQGSEHVERENDLLENENEHVEEVVGSPQSSPRVGSSSQGNGSTVTTRSTSTTLGSSQQGESEHTDAPKGQNISDPTPFQRRNPAFDPDDDVDDDDELGAKRSGPDLEVLARAIMPMVKRMLAIERERRTYR
jgi:hypothetical protein